MKIYRIYTRVNFAETSRDKDDIHTEEVGYKKTLKSAIETANDYIKEHFCRSEFKVKKNKDGSYSATDFCSWGETIIIESKEVK